jgi:hypothetical protein
MRKKGRGTVGGNKGKRKDKMLNELGGWDGGKIQIRVFSV